MSWKTKPSGTMKVPIRSEPYCTTAMLERWQNVTLPKYATRHGALMPILHDVQHAYRHVPYQAMIEIARSRSHHQKCWTPSRSMRNTPRNLLGSASSESATHSHVKSVGIKQFLTAFVSDLELSRMKPPKMACLLCSRWSALVHATRHPLLCSMMSCMND